MKILSLLQRLIPKQMNPIVIKELRQSVRSRVVAGAFLLFLIIELFGVGITLMSSTAAGHSINYYSGRNIFHFLYIALSTTCILFIPVYTSIRLMLERWDNNLDLMYITTIKPQAVIRGKLLASMVITTLMFSAAAPFMAFSYILRGIDIPSILVALVFVFICVVMITQIMIFMACLPTSKAFKILLGLMSIVGLFWSLTLVNIAGWALIQEGVGSKFNDLDFWIMVCGTALSVILTTGMMQRIAVAFISPPASNRSLPVRLYATIVWIITGFCVLGLAVYNKESDIMMAWLIPSVIILCIAVICGVSENSVLSARVRRSIPENPIKRRIAFFFYNGPAGAIFWASTLALLTIVLVPISVFFMDGDSADILDTVFVMLCLFAYIMAYSLSALFLWRKLLYRRFLPITIGVITLIMIFLGTVLPVVITLITKSGPMNWNMAWQVGNVFTIGVEKYRVSHMIFSTIWVITALCINVRWILEQTKSFKRL